MQLNPYLIFNGECAEAFRFYEKTLGGKIEAMMTHGETPAAEHVDASWHDKIMHANLKIGDLNLMGSDAPPGHYQKPQGMSVALHLADAKEGHRMFNALADGGSVTMPFQETFWSAGFGMATDRFGTPWMVNCPPKG